MSYQVVEIDAADRAGNRVYCEDGRFRNASASLPKVFTKEEGAIAEALKSPNRNPTLNLAVLPYIKPSTPSDQITPAPASAHRFWAPKGNV